MVRGGVIRRPFEGVVAGAQSLAKSGSAEEEAGAFDQVASTLRRILRLEAERRVEVVQRGGSLRGGRLTSIGVHQCPGSEKRDTGRRISRPLDGPTERRRRLVEEPSTLLELAQRRVGLVEPGSKRDGGFQVGQRLREPAGLEGHPATVHQEDVAEVVGGEPFQGDAIIGQGGLECGIGLAA